MYAHYFQPTDEYSLRHLFSSRLGEDTLGMSYIGPVLDPSNRILPTTDCLILDRRDKQWHTRTCEFKYVPESKRDFAKNGQFDIAVVWRITPSIRESLREQLTEQHGCQEIIVLSDYPAFSSLPIYRTPKPGELEDRGIEEMERCLLGVQHTGYPTAYVAYIAATVYPLTFGLEMVKEAISEFPEVQRMLPQGRGNVVSKLLQTKPPLVTSPYRNTYKWVGAIHAEKARTAIAGLITTRFERQIPDDQLIAKFKAAAK